MKKIKKIIIGIIILIVLVILFPFILNLFTSDIDPIDDSDLSLQVITISDEENSYYDLIKIEDVLYQPEERREEIIDMTEGRAWDEKLAEEIIFKNKEAFELFSLATKKSKYQNPNLAIPENINLYTEFTAMSSWRIMSEYSSIRALYLSRQGKDKEAIEEALNSLYIGQKIQDSQVSLLEYLVAISIKERGLETVQKIIASADLDNIELKKYVSELKQFYENENGFIAVSKGEYNVGSLSIDALVNGDFDVFKYSTEEQNKDMAKKLNNNYYFRPNKTKALFASYARKKIKNANQFCNNIENVEIKRLAPTSYLEMYISENLVGKVLNDIIANSSFAVIIKKCNEDSLVSSTQALIAIKAYQNDYGNLPDSLNQLVPGYLESVPLDYFNGNQLRYSKENKILYSVGRDGKDEGGSTGEDWKKMPDPTLNINF